MPPSSTHSSVAFESSAILPAVWRFEPRRLTRRDYAISPLRVQSADQQRLRRHPSVLGAPCRCDVVVGSELSPCCHVQLNKRGPLEKEVEVLEAIHFAVDESPQPAAGLAVGDGCAFTEHRAVSGREHVQQRGAIDVLCCICRQ